MSQDRRLSSAPRLDSRTKILYGIGNIADAVKMVLAGLFGLYFYSSVMGLSGTLVGITSAIALVWDALVDPYIGYLSDKARFRFGRRHTFMLAGALTMGIGFWASFSPPQGLSTGALVAWLLGSGLLVRTATSMYSVPYFALGAELSQDYHERTSIAGIRAIMAFLGTLGTASLSFVVFFPNSPTGVDPKLNYAGYPAMGITFGLLMTVVSLIATFGTLSRRHALPMNDKRQMAQTPRNCFISFANSFQNPSFRVLVASTILFWLGVTISGSLSIYYLTYFAEISASTTLSVCQLAFYLAGLLGVCLWLRIAKMVEKHRMYRFSMLVTAALMLGAFLLIGEGSLFGTGNVGAVVLVYAMDGFFGCALWFMPMSLIADVVDEDELTTGQRREGTFFGVYACGQQLAVGISFLLTGVLVDWFAGLVPGQATQSPETVWRVGLLYGVLPAMLLCMAAALTCRYTLGQARVLTIQAELVKQRSPLTSY